MTTIQSDLPHQGKMENMNIDEYSWYSFVVYYWMYFSQTIDMDMEQLTKHMWTMCTNLDLLKTILVYQIMNPIVIVLLLVLPHQSPQMG